MSAVKEWRETRLKNLFTSVRNGIWGDDPDDETDVFCARGTDFDRTTNRISVARMPRRSVTASALRDHQLQHGDLVLEKSGGSADQPVGSVALFDLQIHAVCSNFNARMQVSSSVDPPFACYLVNSLYWSGFTRQFVKQTTGIQNLDAQALLAQRCTLPPLDEQRRIADFLDAETALIDLLVQQRTRQRDALDELVLSMIDNVISKVRKSSTVRLGYLALVQTGITVDGNRQHNADVVTLPYLRVANVQAGYVDLNDIAEITVPRRAAAASRLRAGDVLMTEGGDLDKLGRGTVWYGEIEGCLHQNHVFAVRPGLAVLTPEYLALLTRAPMARKYFESTGNKTTNLASTSSGKIRDFRIPLTDTGTQRAVVTEIDARVKSISQFEERISRQLSLLAERRQALITAAVTGQIDVTTARGLSSSGGVAV